MSIGLKGPAPEATKRSAEPAGRLEHEGKQPDETPAVPSILRLQRTAGNQAVVRLLESRRLQTKLRTGDPGDTQELEADRVAAQVMSMQPKLAGACGCGDGCPTSQNEAGSHQRVQTKSLQTSASGNTDAPPVVNEVLRSPGRPLDLSTQRFFEPLFGNDFSSVRIHTDERAAESTQALQAQAYTVGRDVVFGPGHYAPQTDTGKRLLAHELTHVVQQGRGQRLQSKPEKPSETAKDKTLDSLNACELTLNALVSRYRNWLSHNMILFLADVLNSDKAPEAIAAIKGGFVEGVMKEAVVNAISLGGIELGAKFGGKQFTRIFLSIRVGKIIGGVASFVVGAILESLLGELVDKSKEIVEQTAEQVSALVTGIINPLADSKQETITKTIQECRDGFRNLELADKEWAEQSDSILDIKQTAAKSIPNIKDESLYRQLALMTDVYRGGEVVAEEKPPHHVTSKGSQFSFIIQHKVVKEGPTNIEVVKDKSVVMLELQTFDCEDGEKINVEREAEYRPHLKSPLPDRKYFVTLYTKGIFFDDTISIPRVFQVGKKEYATWYNLSKGTYRLQIERNFYHPVAICGLGKSFVE